MGIQDQFKDKAAKLADQGKQKPGSKGRPEEPQRPQSPQRHEQRSPQSPRGKQTPREMGDHDRRPEHEAQSRMHRDHDA
ncbi:MULTISPECIES: hypothetical protein [unclassified Streptomyces]|uniref:hypothetical protein n=1 Tax=unclassified Streptomyces TaxID=2593676 RepID=UPI0033CA1EED